VAGTALIFGARNLGLAIAERLSGSGWNVAAVARSSATVERVQERLPDAFAFEVDASHPARVADALDQTRERFGTLDLLVNAVSPGPRPGSTFGGGPLADSSPEDLDHYAGFVTRQVHAFLSAGARALRQSGSGTLIQITGGSSRRAIPGRGPWAAGAFASRALTQAAALELREEGIHAALLVVDATIRRPGTEPSDELAEPEDIAAAVEYLAAQKPTSWTHELVITPRGDTFVP
jgi:NAD(P)-dependent dehydrogenase (short-subunit alcohol dehydrogenase family)